MMAEEGASSSSNSFDEAEERRGTRPATYTSSFISHAPADGSCTSVSSTGHMACVNPVSGMIGISRLSYNPFAIKTATPTRSLADSTDNKESRPLVAPPTLKLGGIDSPCGVSSSAPKIVLRPSALAAQAEKLKLVNMNVSGSKQEGKENKLDDSNNVGSKEVNSTNCESNGKISKSEFLASGLPASSDGASRIMTSTPSKSSGMGESSFGFTPNKTEDKAADGASFIFGQNLHERVLNYDDSGVQPSSPADVHNLTFEEAALQKEELEKKEREEQEAKFTKSLTESAKEYQSKQIKRKFDEVTVITGEEEESNVLQMNCKLFAFNKLNSSWQERGRGILRLNDREVSGVLHSRVVMRTQGSLRVVLNTKVWSGMSVEHPSPKTVRLTAIDMQGVKVFLVMANPKDAEQLFSALDWRVTTLKSQEESSNKSYGDKPKSTIEEATSSSGLPDTSSNENYGDSPNKRSRISLSHEGGADSSTEMDFFPGATSEISSDSFVDSTDASNTPCHDIGDGTSLVSD